MSVPCCLFCFAFKIGNGQSRDILQQVGAVLEASGSVGWYAVQYASSVSEESHG